LKNQDKKIAEIKQEKNVFVKAKKSDRFKKRFSRIKDQSHQDEINEMVESLEKNVTYLFEHPGNSVLQSKNGPNWKFEKLHKSNK